MLKTQCNSIKTPKIITLCGSSKFTDIMAVCAWLLEKEEGANTMGLHLLPGWYCKGKIPDHLAEHENVSKQMDKLHLTKIDISDEIFVVNCNDYIGDSTKKEIKHAQNKNIKIRWFTHDYIGTKALKIFEEYFFPCL